MKNLSISFQNFNNRIKQMNQTNGRQLTLSAEEARNLHSDLFSLLAQLADPKNHNTETVNTQPESINLDAGGF